MQTSVMRRTSPPDLTTNCTNLRFRGIRAIRGSGEGGSCGDLHRNRRAAEEVDDWLRRGGRHEGAVDGKRLAGAGGPGEALRLAGAVAAQLLAQHGRVEEGDDEVRHLLRLVVAGAQDVLERLADAAGPA